MKDRIQSKMWRNSERWPDDCPTIKMFDGVEQIGPRISPSGHWKEFPELEHLAKSLIPVLLKEGVRLEEGTDSNASGQVAFWAIDGKVDKYMRSAWRPLCGIFLAIATKLEKVENKKTPARKQIKICDQMRT